MTTGEYRTAVSCEFFLGLRCGGVQKFLGVAVGSLQFFLGLFIIYGFFPPREASLLFTGFAVF